jgi:hypothetical protein
MFRTGPLSIIRSVYLNTVYTQYVFVVLKFQHDKYLLRVYSVEILLMMDSGPVRNM